MRIVEQTVVPSAIDGSGGDRVVVADHLVAVIDAATAKPWDPPDGPSTSETADIAVEALMSTSPDATMEEIVGRCTEQLAAVKAESGLQPGEGSCFVFAVVQRSGRWVGRCGDVTVRLNSQELFAGGSAAERTVARGRALVLRSRLFDGAPPETLRREDPGREAVKDVLRAVGRLRNTTGAEGYAAVDGANVPASLLQVRQLDDAEHELVLASDGYLRPADTLAKSEERLRERLERDPLLIEEPPMTKAWRPDERSFDDRAYLRLRLPAR